MDSLFEPVRSSGGEPRRRVPVLLPVALNQTYDYTAPEDLDLSPGCLAAVPFGRQTCVGAVWDRPVGGRDGAGKTLRPVIARLPVPPLPPVSMRFAEWLARYTLTPLGMVLRLTLAGIETFRPGGPSVHGERGRLGVHLMEGAAPPARLTPARRRVLAAVGGGQIRTRAALAAEAGCSPSTVDGLLAAGLLAEAPLPGRAWPLPDPSRPGFPLTADQETAARSLRDAVAASAFSVTLLDGVTGSGKTEVYFEAIAAALAAGKQVLVLLPEISLTGQFLARFAARFGCPPAEWHSALPKGERGRIWRAVAEGEIRAVAGARSALFLPFRELGLIVADEEHDPAFKQDSGVHYQARDMAVVRASLGSCPIVLVSATPSLESLVNVETGRYRRLVLPSRASGTALPRVETIDLRREPPEPGRWLSPRLADVLAATLAEGRQSLLFLNRRGYAPLTLCRACGHRLECPQCTAWLVEHRFRQRLGCHHCGFSEPVPRTCPACGALAALVACGPGVERVAEEVRERFPAARVALLSSDLVPDLAAMRQILDGIAQGEADIIIGTQMVAKGHHFPALATVGVVDGDLGLAHGTDPRAAERTFQLLHQVTGRAGRAMAGGRGFVQTYNPDHPVMAAIVSGSRDAFVAQEIAVRRAGLLPPFGRLAALIVSARDRTLAEAYAREVARHAPPSEQIEVLGPAEAPLAVVRGRHRWRLLVRAPREAGLQTWLGAWLAAAPPPKGDLRLTVDVDPYNFL